MKKWFMLQLWRLQQVAQILTIAMLALSLTLQLYNFVNWRGAIFETPYTGVPVLLLVLAIIIWGFAVIWDLRLKMWREQATVLIEKNPYAKEKMYSKEIAVYELFWLTVLENLGKDDPKAKASAEALREWLRKARAQDPNTAKDLEEIFHYIGMEKPALSEPKKR